MSYEVNLNTWNKCVNSFKQADRVMGSAFHQKLNAIGAARELYVAENGKEHGFVTRFAEDCGVKKAYVSQVNTISKDQRFDASNFSDLGAETLYALARAPEPVVEAAKSHAEQGIKPTKKSVEALTKAHQQGEEQLEMSLPPTVNQARQQKERDYSKNPMNFEKMATLLYTPLWLMAYEDYAKHRTPQEIADNLWSYIQGIGGKEQDVWWEQLCLDSMHESIERLHEAAKYLPKKSQPNLKRVK